MSRRCALTGKGHIVGNNVSHVNNKTKRRQFANLQEKKIFVPEINRSIRLRLSTEAMRSVEKVGFMKYLKKQGLTLKDIV